ncbi:MAG: RDD family protein [Fimbriimonas sp.]
MNHELAILSPEKTIVTYRLAGLGSRVGAQVIDLVVVVAIMYLLSLPIMMFALVDSGIATFVQAIISTLGFFLYFILCESLWNGQTVGKRALHLRVRYEDGTPITFVGALGRNLLRVADILPTAYFVGLLSIITNPKSQRIGDIVAGTIVCYEPLERPTFTVAPHQAGIHRYEALVGDLVGMTVEDYLALRRFCDRYPELTPARRDRFIAELWRPIARKVGIDDAATVHPLELAEAAVMKYGRIHGLL